MYQPQRNLVVHFQGNTILRDWVRMVNKIAYVATMYIMYASYNASTEKVFNATSSLVRFEAKIFSPTLKKTL
jgi:hypothetical protein